MKQLFISLALLLGAVTPAVEAQSFTGSWEIFPNYGTPASIVETPEYVYTLAGFSLCGYDKTTDEVLVFNTANRLNGNQVSGIWYDPQEKYLLVVYTDYNIDLLFDDGRIINVPDLRDAAISQNKQVKTVGFAGGKAYIGLGGGMIVLDAEHGAVTESCLWGFQVDYIAATDKKILLFSTARSEGKWFVGDRNGSHHNFEKAFTASAKSVYPHGAAIAIGQDAVMIGSTTNAYCLKVDNEATDNSLAITSTPQIAGVSGLDRNSKSKLQVSKSGATAVGGGKVYHINADGTLGATFAVPASATIVADWEHSDNAAWVAEAAGYGKYDLAGQTYAIRPVKPNSTSGSNVGIFRQLDDGTVYMSTVGVNGNTTIYPLAWNKVPLFDSYKDGHFTQFLPTGFGTNKHMYSFIVNPANSNELLVHCFSKSGIANIETDQITWFDSTNSGLVSKPTNSMAIDSHGNLWPTQWSGAEGFILNKALAGKWLDKSGWSRMIVPGLKPEHEMRIVIDEARGNIVLAASHGLGILKMPQANQPLTDDCRSMAFPISVDEDGLSTSAWRFPTIVIDQNGWIWIGSDSGVFVVKNSDDMFNSSWAPMRPKVARNDGTNLADLLLDNIEVLDIAVDSNNQKWISTVGSGLYRVSSDGTKIIDHFTTENSDIPSDIVLGTLPDRFSNKVFVGTDQGLAIYNSTTSPAADDYSDVYAFPNPVTPDYTGWITITGLMDGSLVKIADAAGRVFFQGKSDGGLITWNGCDASGRRVKSGVYFVFASQHQEGASSSGAVTKIVVVN